ncbi:MAG: MFS transporter [Propionibacteriales bacterium]|nr:MFS transporter [Propionibacteriales bacterium]
MNRAAVRFWGLAYVLLILLTGTNLATPLYGLYQSRFGFAASTVTLVFAVYVGTLIPALLLAGPLADAVGRRAVLLPAVAVAALGAGIFAYADSTSMLFLGRAVQGLSVGAASGALTAAIADAEPSGDQRKASLVATAASVGGLGLGPLVAGLLAELTPWPLLAPFLFELLALAPAIFAVLAIPASRTRNRWRPTMPRPPAGGRGMFWMSAAASFLAFSVTGLFLALAPSYVQLLSGQRSLILAGAVVALMIGASVVAQLIGADRITPHSQVPGLVVLAVGLIALAVSGLWGSLPLLLVAAVVAGIGQGVVFLGGLGEITRLAPTEQRAAVVSAFYVMVYLGVGVPVIGVGILATFVELLTAVVVFSVVVAAGCLITAGVLRPLLGRAS